MIKLWNFEEEAIFIRRLSIFATEFHIEMEFQWKSKEKEKNIATEMKQGKWNDEDEYRLSLHVPQDVLFDNRL